MKRKLFCIISAVTVMLTVLLCGCGYRAPDDGRISIVTTCFPPYDFARAVAGDSADISMLLSTGAEAHSYEPTPLDIATIQGCDIFVCIGDEDEVWVDKILDSIDTDSMTVIRLIEYVEPLEEDNSGIASDSHDHDHDHDHAHEHGDGGEEYDGHIWTSPKNAQLCVRAIEEALCEKFPENTELYRSGGEAYSAQLEQLDRDFREMTENAPENIIIVGDRFPFRYLAHDYGLEYFAAFSGCSSESEPSVHTMAFLIDELLEHDTDVVFYLEFSSKKLAEKLCDAVGARMLPLHSCHNVSKDDFENGTTYIDLMKDNLINLREALY